MNNIKETIKSLSINDNGDIVAIWGLGKAKQFKKVKA